MLTLALRNLERDGLVTRTQFSGPSRRASTLSSRPSVTRCASWRCAWAFGSSVSARAFGWSAQKIIVIAGG